MSSFFKDMFIEDFPQMNYSKRFNISHDEDSMIIEAIAIGVKKEDVDINIEDGILEISAKTSRDHGWIGLETFSRRIRIPEGTIEEDISAELSDGILRVIIPKEKEIKKSIKRIEIK